MEDQKHVDPLADTIPDVKEGVAATPATTTTTTTAAADAPVSAPATTTDNAEAVAPQPAAVEEAPQQQPAPHDPAAVPAPSETAPSAVVAAAAEVTDDGEEKEEPDVVTTTAAGEGDEKKESAPEADVKETTNTEAKETSALNTNSGPALNTNSGPVLNTNSAPALNTNSGPANSGSPVLNTNSSPSQASDQLEALKQAVEQKRAELREKEQQLAEHEATQELLKEVQIRHQSVSKEVTELDKKKAQTVPEYESVKMNAYLRDDAAKLRADIEDHLAKVATSNAEAAELEAELSETSKQYKEETTKRNAFLKYVTDSITSLQTAIAKKIAVTSGDGSTVDAADGLELLADTVRTRERQLASLEKEANEHKHICENDDVAIRELEQSSTTNVKRLREQKDEAIREAVFSFQDERAKLHTDIEDMKKINKEQSEQLKVGERRKLVEKGGFGKKSTTDPAPQVEQEALNQRAEDMRVRNDELREEINVIRD